MLCKCFGNALGMLTYHMRFKCVGNAFRKCYMKCFKNVLQMRWKVFFRKRGGVPDKQKNASRML